MSYKKSEILQVNKDLKIAINRAGKEKLLKLLLTVPGIGFIAAATLITEINDIKRFPNFDSLVSFAGLVPSVRSSGDKEVIGCLTNRRNRHLLKMLIEASWGAVRKDPAILKSFSELSKRMKKQKAIITKVSGLKIFHNMFAVYMLIWIELVGLKY